MVNEYCTGAQGEGDSHDENTPHCYNTGTHSPTYMLSLLSMFPFLLDLYIQRFPQLGRSIRNSRLSSAT